MAIFGNRAQALNATSEDAVSETMRTEYRAEATGITATIATPQGDIVVNIHNLSTRGLMASAPNPPAVGDRIDVKIDSLPWVHGQVRWVKESRFGILLFTALPVAAFRIADQGRGRRARPPRYVVRIPVRIEAPGIARSAIIQNISHNGLALETGLPVNPGKLLAITIEGLPPITGRVRWSRGSRCGVMLDDALDQDVLAALIKIR